MLSTDWLWVAKRTREIYKSYINNLGSCRLQVMRKMRFSRSYKWVLLFVVLFAICIGLRLVVLSLRNDYLEVHRLKLSNRQPAGRWSYLPVHVVEEHHEGIKVISKFRVLLFSLVKIKHKMIMLGIRLFCENIIACVLQQLGMRFYYIFYN